jgi:hypothetical protein
MRTSKGTDPAALDLYGRRITNSHEFKDAMFAAMADAISGKISVREAREINRKASTFLKIFKQRVAAR